MDKVYNVLFLCTGNSARSIMAESLLNREGKGRFKAYSAGSHPTGRVNPDAVRLLESRDHLTADLRSKSWDEFAAPGAPKMDLIFTVCDNAAGEVCPVWPGHPTTAHWPFPDPAALEGTDAERLAFFADVYGQIEKRVAALCRLPVEVLEGDDLHARLQAAGADEGVAG